MISPDHDIIFIPIPKCAGVSVRAFLRGSGFRPSHLGHHPEDVRSGFYRRGVAERMLRHGDRDLWNRSLKFCVCRNPYDRLVSGWSFCRAQNHTQVPFDYFVRYLHTFDSFGVVWHCVLSQTRHVSVDDTPAVDVVCRFEHLESDLQAIRARVGRPDAALPHQNRSAHKSYREYYTRELQDIVFERFADDFNCFGYGYDL